MESGRDTTSTAEWGGKRNKLYRGHEITSKTMKTPQFSYAHLELISASQNATDPRIDPLTVRSYIGFALRQFLGLTGSAISFDILKVEGWETWIRVPREDLSSVLAAVGGWTGFSEIDGNVGWRIKSSGTWLGVLIASGEAPQIWNQ